MKATIKPIRDDESYQECTRPRNFTRALSLIAPGMKTLPPPFTPKLLIIKLYETPYRSYCTIMYTLPGTPHVGKAGGTASGKLTNNTTAAIANAFKASGISLSESIGGSRSEAVIDAIGAVAQACGLTTYYIDDVRA